MAENTKIEWCSHTFNHVRGCTKVSAGCANCYAEAMSGRNPGTLGAWGPNGTRVVAAEAQWKLPIRWNHYAGLRGQSLIYGEAVKVYPHLPKCEPHEWDNRTIDENNAWLRDNGVDPFERPRVFCASLADVFEDWTGPMSHSDGGRLVVGPHGEWRSIPYSIQNEENHGRLIQTKTHWLTMSDVRARLFSLIDATPNLDWLLLTKRPENVMPMYIACDPSGVTPDNLWIGTSVENQHAADERIPHLLQIPAAVRFLSVEPLLGPIVLDQGWSVRGKPWVENGVPAGVSEGIDWVIVGGESGHGARPCNVEWIRSIVKQCRAADVACFTKQLGANYADAENGICGKSTPWPFEILPSGPFRRLVDAKGGEPQEWPEDLRVREFPRTR